MTTQWQKEDKMANNTMVKRGQNGKQHNGKKRTKWQTTQWQKEDKMANNDLQNTTMKTKKRATRTPLKT